MSLYKRLHEQQGGGATPVASRRDPVLDDLRQKIHHHLIDELGPILYDKRLTEDDLRRRVQEQLQNALSQERAPLSATDKAQLIQDVSDDILGYGPIDRLLKDEDITEVMVNGPDSVYVERSGKVEKTTASFVDDTHPRRIIDKIVGQVGRRIDEAQPLCDARLPDGSRVNAVIHPLAIGGPFLTIRKFSKDPYQIDDLIRFGTMNAASARFLQAMVVGKLNVVVCGGTGTAGAGHPRGWRRPSTASCSSPACATALAASPTSPRSRAWRATSSPCRTCSCSTSAWGSTSTAATAVT